MKTTIDFIPTRFYVEWHPTNTIAAECIRQGMKPDDGTSFRDWCDVLDYARTKTFTDFDDAVAFALAIAPQDYFGGVRLYRQQQSVVKDGKRSFIRWDDQCYWDGLNGDHCPDLAKPDEYCTN